MTKLCFLPQHLELHFVLLAFKDLEFSAKNLRIVSNEKYHICNLNQKFEVVKQGWYIDSK
jgi:hypothetical protein